MEPESPTVANAVVLAVDPAIDDNLSGETKSTKAVVNEKVGVDVHDGSFPETLTAPNFIY